MIIFFLNDKFNMLLSLNFIQKIALLFTKKKIVNVYVHAAICTLS